MYWTLALAVSGQGAANDLSFYRRVSMKEVRFIRTGRGEDLERTTVDSTTTTTATSQNRGDSTYDDFEQCCWVS